LWSVQATEGTAAEGDGTLTLSPDPLTGASIIVVSSNSLYDFTGGQATVQVNEVVGFGGVNNLFSIQVNGNNALEWRYDNGMLLGNYYVAGARTVAVSLPYSASQHALWRIREYNGVVLWETSPDGSSWTTQGTAATARLFSLQSVNVLLAADTFGDGSPDPGRARYSNLNVQ